MSGVVAQHGTYCDVPYADLIIQNVREDLPVGSVLRQLSISGSDADITVWTSQSNPYVSFDPISRNLTLAQELDAETLLDMNLQLNLQLTCQILSTSQTIHMNIIIIVQDVNDNPPIFQRQEYTVTVSELTPVGTVVLSGITASDADIGNSYVYYEIQEGPYSSYFDIPIPAQGSLKLEKPLDYEASPDISITIVAKDYHSADMGSTAQPSLSTTAVVRFIVEDGDDQNPVFYNAPYSARIPENSEVGYVVNVEPALSARDGDIGINTKILYSIISDAHSGASNIPSYSDYFSIEPDTGVVRLAQTGLRRNSQPTIQIKATQENSADRYSSTLLRVVVQTANRNPPHFQMQTYSSNLVENVPIGSAVITVIAYDNDQGLPDTDDSSQGSLLAYSIPAGQGSIPFRVDSGSGNIVTTQLLDYEKTQLYNITVTVSDGHHISSCQVLINVLDINDNAPIFSRTSYKFNAERLRGSSIGQVQVTDVDSMPVLSYSLLENSTIFQVSSDGLISITPYISVDDISRPEYTFVIVAHDSALPSQQSSALVRVVFEEGPDGGAITGSETQEVDVVLLIILGVICGILLVTIIILLVYIYRNNVITDKEHRMRAQTFECRFNQQQQQKENISQRNSYLDDPAMQYKQNIAHHMALYNSLSTDSSTTPQQSPFIPDESYDATCQFNSNNSVDANHNRAYRVSTGDVNRAYSSDGSDGINTVQRRMPDVHEIEYHTSVAPMEDFIHRGTGVRTSIQSISSSESMLPGSSSSGELVRPVQMGSHDIHGYRSGGSTQNLVTPKGTAQRRKLSAVSSIPCSAEDGPPLQYTTRDIDHGLHMVPGKSVADDDDDRGITVYY